MKNFTTVLSFLLFLNFYTASAQEEIRLLSKDTIVQSSWMIGIGYNFVDDSGDGLDRLLSFDSQWHTTPYPNRISVGRYFKSGLGVEVIGSYNKYQAGKNVDGVISQFGSDYFGADARLSYDLNKVIGETAWFDPYVGVGLGYTDANNQSRATFNGVVGFRTWITKSIGLDFNSTGKWRISKNGTNHLQHAAGVVYRFGMETGLSKKGEEKLALINELEKEKQRVNDSIAAVNSAKEAAALADRLAQEREKNRLAEIERDLIEKEKQRKLTIEKAISDLGAVHFALNSSQLNEKSKEILASLAVLLVENPAVELKISAHTDSRGQADYNKWLSQRRVDKTVEYLIGQGVSASRLVAESYGEENLLNECDDRTYCPESKHQVNRRSEFMVTKY